MINSEKNSHQKQVFIQRTNQQIKVYQTILKGLLTCKPIITQFSGKVLNKRLSTALNNALPDPCLSVWLDDKDIIYHDKENRSYQALDKSGWYYVSIDRFSFKIDVDRENRINEFETITNLTEAIRLAELYINQGQKDLKLYDEHEKAYNELMQNIENYKQKYTGTLRGFFADIQISEKHY